MGTSGDKRIRMTVDLVAVAHRQGGALSSARVTAIATAMRHLDHPELGHYHRDGDERPD